MNHAHALEGFDMSIKLEKPKIKERCSQILALRKFRDIMDRSQERNRMNEDSFLELMQLHNQMKNKSQNPSEFLQLTEVKHIIKDYCEQKFKDTKLQDEKRARYLKLIVEFSDSENFTDQNLYNAFLRIDAQIQKLVLDNKAQSTRIIEQNEELKESFKKVLDQNASLKSKLDELKDDFGASNAKSTQLIEEVRKENVHIVTKVDSLLIKNEEHRNEIEILKTQSKEILEHNIHLKENLYKVLVENSHIKGKTNALLLKNEEFKSEFTIIKDQSLQLTHENILIQGKLDKILYENEYIKLKSESVLSQLTQKNSQTLEKNIQLIPQSNIILQKSNILYQENMAIEPKLNNEFPEEIKLIIPHSFLSNKIKIDKKIPRLHTDILWKIISYENYTKYITCSEDKRIIIRNCEDNKIIRMLTNHKGGVRDIFLLSDGRLASASKDNTIKIWNLTNDNCEQTLIGHSHWVYCLLELPNSILLSGSQDSTIGVWNISQKEKKELQFHQLKNDKQSYVYCMTLINVNELAASSYKDINIYSFNSTIKTSFSINIIKTLKGHTDSVFDIKMMKDSKDLLVSCSSDEDCRLWSISREVCLKIFKGHSGAIWSIQILSDKTFVSGSAEIFFWNIDSESINSIKPDQSENKILSLIMNNRNELIFVGQHDFIGLIKI